MKITKFVHSCLLVEMPAPINRTALFDPGVMSESALDVNSLEYLDNIVITHNHPDHLSLPLLHKLVAKFPDVRITAPDEVVQQLAAEGITALSEETPGVVLFDAPHEDVEPMFPSPQEIGVHYLGLLTHPGDSHSFSETRAVLALPVSAPWGSTLDATRLALKLKPKYVLPIHDWHWHDAARDQMYGNMETVFKKHGIEFLRPETGKPIVLDIAVEGAQDA